MAARNTGCLLRAGGITLAIFGAIFFTSGVYDLIVARSMESWRTAPGIVERSEIALSRGFGKYDTVVLYSYQVGGTTYRARRIEAGGFLFGTRYVRDLSYSEAAGLVSRFQSGQSISVWYRPDHPAHAVLIRKINPHAYGAAIGGAVLLALALALRAAARRAEARRAAERRARP